MKFKIGNKVRSIIDDINANVYVGYIGTVVDYDSDDDIYYVEFKTTSGWFKTCHLELKPDEQPKTVVTKYVVIYKRVDGLIESYYKLFDSEEKARSVFESVYKPEDIVAIKEITWTE